MRPHAAAALLVLGTLGLGPSQAAAEAYPWVALGPDDLRVVPDPKLEAALRLEMVRRAKKTIDIANYDQRADAAIALPLASALRDAANRGVRVRFMVSWNTTVLFDYYNKVGELLVDPPAATPIEYLVVGGPNGEDQGFGLLEGLHEKYFLVDRTDLVTTGRGIGEAYLYWLDCAYALRGPLAAQAQQSFDRIWREARLHHAPYAGYLGGQTQQRAPRYPESKTTWLAPHELAERDALLAWFAASPAPSASPSKGVTAGARGRLLHFDFLKQIHALSPTPVEVDVDERLTKLDDPVVKAILWRLATAKVVRIALISTILPPPLLQALLAAKRRGADITLFINTCAPRLNTKRTPIEAGGTLWSMQLPDLDDLLSAGVRVVGFQIRDGSPWLFLHKKLAVLDDVAIFGSHNLNVPSSAFFDEASFEIESPALARDLAARFDADLLANGEPIDPARVRRDRNKLAPRLLRWLSLPYLGYM